jgi:regulatory protein
VPRGRKSGRARRAIGGAWAGDDQAEMGEATAGEWPGGEQAGQGAAAVGWPGGAGPDRAAADRAAAAPGKLLSGDRAGPGEAAGGEWFGGEEAARAACLKLLTSAPRTRAQLAAALRRRKVPDEIAEFVLARFAEVGLIDDAAFARAWVESRHHGRGLARKALAAELRQRGVADEEVRAAVGTLKPEDEDEAARRLVAKRIAATRGRPLPARARSLLGMLARKGYPAGLAARVVREALEQDEADSPEDRLDLALICEDSAASDWL